MADKPGPATTYQRIDSAVQNIVFKHNETTDGTTICYMIARAALLRVRGNKGAKNAAALAYRLADEFAGEGVK